MPSPPRGCGVRPELVAGGAKQKKMPWTNTNQPLPLLGIFFLCEAPEGVKGTERLACRLVCRLVRRLVRRSLGVGGSLGEVRGEDWRVGKWGVVSRLIGSCRRSGERTSTIKRLAKTLDET